MKKIWFCPICWNELEKEKDKSLKKNYKWFCKSCDQNFFEFEAQEKK